ncbi:MAG: YafY family transcriptional regulator [Firmicutes bacterium]|uniref:DNA-binding transcriptional regulator n=1 Tax=Sulfobacillus benefaciens TaxID=453960 RepID=A0A2T2WZF9_9FIRM|nr:YafY family transcriptional regulator [Bacillota bacterium]PSR27596.1 MAG: hypothetical protein C7B43_11605 [Sulfobacillus benefaciens]
MAKSDNMLSLLWLLYARERMTAAQLAEELEISIRTVYRYIDSLCASGVPIISDSGHDGGYRLAPGFRGTPLFFDPGEVSALFHATKFAQNSGYPYTDVLDQALRKLQRTLAPGQMAHLEKHVMGFEVVPYLRGGSVEPWLGILEESVAQSRTVNMLYQKLNAEEPEWRQVEPYGLAFSAGVWYLAAFCRSRRALRTFRVDRIQNLNPTDAVFTRPADFSVQDYFSDKQMRERIEREPHSPVRVEGTPWAIASLCDHWFLRLCVLEQERTRVILRIPTVRLDEAALYLISYGDSIQIIEPNLLRQRMATLCYAWGKHFEQNGDVD